MRNSNSLNKLWEKPLRPKLRSQSIPYRTISTQSPVARPKAGRPTPPSPRTHTRIGTGTFDRHRYLCRHRRPLGIMSSHPPLSHQ